MQRGAALGAGKGAKEGHEAASIVSDEQSTFPGHSSQYIAPKLASVDTRKLKVRDFQHYRTLRPPADWLPHFFSATAKPRRLSRSAAGIPNYSWKERPSIDLPDKTPAMGRYNFAPQRVHQAATRLLQGRKGPAPPWYSVIGNLPPSERLVRPPLQPAQRKGRKASKLFQPVKLQYPEDQLRLDFFGDHPWELARPRQILEDDGKDYQKFDWSQLDQPTKQVDGERCVHRINTHK